MHRYLLEGTFVYPGRRRQLWRRRHAVRKRDGFATLAASSDGALGADLVGSAVVDRAPVCRPNPRVAVDVVVLVEERRAEGAGVLALAESVVGPADST